MAQQIKIAELIAEARLDTDRMIKELRQLRDSVDKRTDQMVNEFKKVERRGTSIFKRLGASMIGAFSGVAAFFAAGAVFRGFKRMIGLASDTTESMNKVKEVFEDSAAPVIKFADTAATSLGATRQEALAMTGEIGNLLVAMGGTPEAAAKMSIEITKLAADLGSFNNVPTVEALNAIRSALVGEAEPIRRFGSDVRVARLEQIALAEGIDKSKLATDAFTKATVSLKAIFQDTAKAQGDFERTSDDFANLMKTISSLVKDVAAKLGLALIPKITELAREAKSFITGTKFDAFIDNLATNFSILADKISEAVKALVSWINQVSKPQTVRQVIDELIEARTKLVEFRNDLKRNIELPSNAKNLISEVLGADSEANIENINAAIALTSKGIKKLITDVRKGKKELDELLVISQPSEPKGSPSKSSNSGTGIDIDAINETNKALTQTSEKQREIIANTLNIASANDRLRATAEGAYVDPLDLFLAKMDDAEDNTLDLSMAVSSVAAGLGRAVATGGNLVSVLARAALQFAALQFAGPLGIAASFLGGFFKHGGSAQATSSALVTAATGLSGTVPVGFPQDNFTVGVSTGERVNVETPFQASANDRLLRNIFNAQQATNANIALLATRQDIIEANVSLEGRDIMLTVEKEQQLRRRFSVE